MTKEEARQFGLNLLHGIVERNKVSNPCYADNVKQAIDALSAPSLPSNLDEAAKSSLKEALQKFYDTIGKPYALVNESEVDEFGEFLFRAGAEFMAGQGWIDDGSMPPETKHESDTLQGHREWTESKPVLAWDSMYGCRIDWTRNGKWMSEQTGGYTGQVCHGIIAWRPIPEYKERHFI